jgi:hypothetical protein
MLTCQEVTELVTDYLEGRMSLWRRAQFQMHVGMCRHCRAYLRQMRMTVRTLGKLPNEPVPMDVRDALLARFRNVELPGPAPAPAWSVRLLSALEKALGAERGWGVVAATVLLVLIGLSASGLEPGRAGDGLPCLLTELGTASVLLLTLGWLATSRDVHFSPGTWTALAVAGSLVGFGIRQTLCLSAHTAPHVLPFHAGGVVLAALLGAFVSRLPALR